MTPSTNSAPHATPQGASNARGTGSGESDVASDLDAPIRKCSMRMCTLEASSSATSDYRARIMAVGPLSPTADPAAVDLCPRHARDLVLPGGWSRIDYEP